jgi:S1-C subfamily serine protease
MRVVPQLISEGRYTRPALGIDGDDDINDRLKRATGIEGVFVLRVLPGSAAERAGLVPAQRTRRGVVPGDIITALNGKPVARLGDLLARLDDFRIGQSVELTLRRGAEERSLQLELQAGN